LPFQSALSLNRRADAARQLRTEIPQQRETFRKEESTMSALGRMGSSSGILHEDCSEGTIARRIEEQTAKLPSDIFLWAAVGSMGCSLMFRMMGDTHRSLFVGQWAPTFLILGLYNKLVKVAGSDRRN
jgi:hypothetical protein